tara:strand:- start:1464 stop:1574 length:111 start_codon:yes stop_codon:yes gene_type:complete
MVLFISNKTIPIKKPSNLLAFAQGLKDNRKILQEKG